MKSTGGTFTYYCFLFKTVFTQNQYDRFTKQNFQFPFAWTITFSRNLFFKVIKIVLELDQIRIVLRPPRPVFCSAHFHPKKPKKPDSHSFEISTHTLLKTEYNKSYGLHKFQIQQNNWRNIHEKWVYISHF